MLTSGTKIVACGICRMAGKCGMAEAPAAAFEPQVPRLVVRP